MLPFWLLLALIWGGIWAAILQWSGIGQFIARKRTWFSVVIGIGVDLLIMLAVIPFDVWVSVVSVIALSSVFIILRSLYNEHHETAEVIHHAQEDAG